MLAKRWYALYIQTMPGSREKKLADVVFPLLPLKTLTYLVPIPFRDEIGVGHRVVVPVGKRHECGLIVSFPEKTPLKSLKPIEDLVEPEPLLSQEIIDLAKWASDYYMCTIGEVIRAMLPSVLHRETDLLLKKNQEAAIPGSGSDPGLPKKQQSIMSLFETRDTLTFHTVQKNLKMNALRHEIRQLESLGLIHVHYILEEPRSRPKMETRITLLKSPSEADWDILKKAPRQAEILKQIIGQDGCIVRSDLNTDLSVLRNLEQRGWISLSEKETYRDPYAHIVPGKPKDISLTTHQSEAVGRITESLKCADFIPFLLYGITASGKTQVYIEVVREALNQGKTALILIPEISLTPQAVQRYRSVFHEEVAIVHSRMSHGERFDSWRKLKEGKCRIALGPRSAVFAPLGHLGVIIVDEEHDASYKQNDPAPRYHARDLAIMRASINRCVVVLGSASPSFESYANAKEGKYRLCRLPERIDQVELPAISLVDRNEVPGEYRRRIISPLLEEKIGKCLAQGEQTILLQNRRGYATFLRCRSCGSIETCVNCDITLTYHRTDCTLRCHLCGYQKAAPSSCSQCGGPNLGYRGTGTQKVEEEIRSLFEEIRLLRMDTDTTRSKHAHSDIVHHFENHQADLLLGTQMVAKGHDFPGVSLVGVISADTGLLFPDFRAEERTFQMLLQAAGRAGRRHRRGEVVIQTFYPDHPIFAYTLNQDYEAFFEYAIAHRRSLNYPPFGKLIVLRFRGPWLKSVENAARAFSGSLPEHAHITKLGPVASPISRKKGQYLYQIVLRSAKQNDKSGRKLRDAIRAAMRRYENTYHFPDVRLIVDVDPVDLL
ncbi:primosomal protein N' [bacterium]|nr:primosomal protein N' [bacterium]